MNGRVKDGPTREETMTSSDDVQVGSDLLFADPHTTTEQLLPYALRCDRLSNAITSSVSP